ncbi:hypothetical protein COS93_00115 [bacterium (Candidatus Gribaldobacteria) CG07_land_8_20_14_0_80_33_18]|uniref:Type II secretion system protein GspF domain-containing protein n=1 Tax=bacterium (Candidatus Gribaldobacteria) CG07_land_8_20_14_0_80_33_18 TaxID=2014272 RepID=A0A2M6Z4G2_9BACT|nr:MAG: hypothetical protein COS93_00115 [bacterium (Candidatus Gribaldobacteria) CG07_land_8_20_14_0_80_33_18]PJA00971.1 MAG: hypothetical protein COX75_01115 [bacterium (Candidatus Gribaldobacteria) CG_4_10_14_0_2_um_filter_33_15]PJB08726.1 MAG: hypothetical protein CO122_01005 [bacterium (Candidatus Gribaldobacteria) CG_4_9_14_3_um_filter_33_9]
MKFLYQARTKEGRIQSGTIEASSRKATLDILEKYGLQVTSLTAEAGSIWQKKIVLSKKISLRDITVFTRQLSVMLKSAVAPVEALRAQMIQTENPNFKEKILKIAETVESGNPLSRAFSFFPEVFDSFYISCLRSGEASGKVADSLNYLADHLEREFHLQQKIRGAMIYPIFVIVVLIGVIFLAAFFIVPNLSEVLKNFGTKLPLSTRAIISFSDFIKEGGWILIFVILGAIFITPFLFKRSKEGKKSWDKFSLKLPILGEFYKKVSLTRFSENLSVLISAGLPITSALEITKSIIGNDVYEKIVAETGERVARGETISSVFLRYPEVIPAFVTQMISTGEKTGRLEDTLMDVVNFYKAEIDRTINNLTSILEPILLLVLGIGVGIMVISLFLPLFSIGLGGMEGM